MKLLRNGKNLKKQNKQPTPLKLFKNTKKGKTHDIRTKEKSKENKKM